ncbi:MAG: ABC transporter permease [Actinomycetota bacterium]|nr:ABC transporter permease [Actinomycetota bacterium]
MRTDAAPAQGESGAMWYPPAHPTACAAFRALLLRDLRVLRREWVAFLVGSLMQPLLLVFVFAYVLPKVGLAVGGAARAGVFSTLLVAGVVGLSMFMQGLQAVTIRFAIEFGYTREIEDRVMAPLPVWALAVEKVVAGALQALAAGAVVLPIAALVPATAVHLHPNVPALVAVGLLAAFLSAVVGLVVGTLVDPGQIQLAFGAIVVPVTFFGAVYYPWAALTPIPWLKYLALANPLVYISEGLRGALSVGVPHMNLWLVLLGMSGFIVALGVVGIRGFRRRVSD